MTVPVQVLAAVRSIPHPRQESDMTAPDPSPAEQAVIDRFGIFDEEKGAVPDPRFRDQLLYALRTAPDIPVLWPSSDKIVDALMPTIAAEVEARVQAAAKRGAMEERGRWITALGVLAARHSLRWFALELRDRVAALASPAPAPRAEEGQAEASRH